LATLPLRFANNLARRSRPLRRCGANSVSTSAVVAIFAIISFLLGAAFVVAAAHFGQK
jgi:hypothetical protein